MSKILGRIAFVVCGLLALYVGGWVLFIKPIYICCMVIDAGNLTGMLLFWSLVKMALASIVGGVIYCIGYILYRICEVVGEKYNTK